MVWQFIEVFKKIVNGQKIQDDDFADRLSHRYTVILLLIFCVLVGSTQFVGSPITCWAPAHFTGPMVSYANSICWIKNTYYVPTDEILPTPNAPRQYRINYYQWVPFILIFMAFLFYVPFAIWHIMCKQHNIQPKSVMKIIQHMDQTNTETREKSIRTVAKLIDRSIDCTRDWNDLSCIARFRRMMNRCFLPLYKRNGSYISTLYMITKLLYVANVCGQFFLLNAFMGPDFNLYGFHVIRDLWQGKDFWESPRFPRETMCDFTIRTLGENNQRNTIQCVLSINLFNEKIFIFIWFWLVIVATLSVYNLLIWLYNMTSTSRIDFIRSYLRRNANNRIGYNTYDSKILEEFIFNYLQQDGVFLIRIIKKNSNDVVTDELMSALWEQFKRSPKNIHNNDDTLSKDNEKLNVAESLIPNGYHQNIKSL